MLGYSVTFQGQDLLARTSKNHERHTVIFTLESKMTSCMRHFNKLKLIHELPKLTPQILNCFFLVTSEVIISSALLLTSYVLRKLFRSSIDVEVQQALIPTLL